MTTKHDSFKKLMEEEQGRKMVCSLVKGLCPELSRRKVIYSVSHEVCLFKNETQSQSKRFIDTVIMVNPRRRNDRDFHFSIGIEVKTYWKDLLNDKKYHDYLGFTNYFVFGVPKKLINLTQKTITDPKIGIVNVETGEIVRPPSWTDVTKDADYSMMKRMLIGNHKPQWESFQALNYLNKPTLKKIKKMKNSTPARTAKTISVQIRPLIDGTKFYLYDIDQIHEHLRIMTQSDEIFKKTVLLAAAAIIAGDDGAHFDLGLLEKIVDEYRQNMPDFTGDFDAMDVHDEIIRRFR